MSTTVTKKIDEATVLELRQFANEVKGLSIPMSATRPVVLAALQAVHSEDTITITVTKTADHPPVKKASSPSEPGSPEWWDDMVTVTIAKNEDVGGAEPVWLGCNGRGIWVPRGYPCKIKRKYLHILENSVRTIYEQDPNVNGRPGDLIPRQVMSYPFMSPDTGQVPRPQAA
jgi:hypothetical protein